LPLPPRWRSPFGHNPGRGAGCHLIRWRKAGALPISQDLCEAAAINNKNNKTIKIIEIP